MAGDRLTSAVTDGVIRALAVLAVPAACDPGAEAAPTPPPPGPVQPAVAAALPAGWEPLPAVALAAQTAGAEVPDVALAAAAWGDPAAGCYLVAVDVRGARRDRMRTVLDKLGWHLDAQAVMHAWEAPTTEVDPATVSGRLTVGELTGAVRGVVTFDARALPRAGLAACFYNDREPRACEAACADLLPRVQAPPVTP